MLAIIATTMVGALHTLQVCRVQNLAALFTYRLLIQLAGTALVTITQRTPAARATTTVVDHRAPALKCHVLSKPQRRPSERVIQRLATLAAAQYVAVERQQRGVLRHRHRASQIQAAASGTQAGLAAYRIGAVRLRTAARPSACQRLHIRRHRHAPVDMSVTRATTAVPVPILTTSVRIDGTAITPIQGGISHRSQSNAKKPASYFSRTATHLRIVLTMDAQVAAAPLPHRLMQFAR